MSKTRTVRRPLSPAEQMAKMQALADEQVEEAVDLDWLALQTGQALGGLQTQTRRLKLALSRASRGDLSSSTRREAAAQAMTWARLARETVDELTHAADVLRRVAEGEES